MCAQLFRYDRAKSQPAWRRAIIAIKLSMILAIIPTTYLGAQQQVSLNTKNHKKTEVEIDARFVKAFRVDVDTQVQVFKIPEEVSRQMFIRIRGLSNEKGIVVDCHIITPHGQEHNMPSCYQSPVKNIYHAANKNTYTTNTVFYQRVFSGGSHKKDSNIAIDFLYL